MQSIEQTKAIINQSTPTEENPIIIKPFEDYKSYNKYYKASVIYNTNFINPQLTIMRSYQTDIAIYNRRNGFLILNLDYYNSSKTTKEQLEHFLFKYVPAFKQGVIYLTDNKFNELMETFYTSDVGLYENKEYNILKIYKHDKNIIETLKNPFLTLPEKLEELEPYMNLNIDAGRPFKTTTERIFIYTSRNPRSNIKFKIIRRFKKYKQVKNYHKKITYEKLILPDEPNFYNDPRKQTDKTLFNGYDMGVTNTKDLKKQTFNNYRMF